MNNKLVNIIYEDEDVLVVNKEAGIEVDQPHDGNENNIVNYLKKYVGSRPSMSGSTPTSKVGVCLVHRLDKFTSGLVVIAKNEKAQKNLEQQFRNRKVKKIYHAIVIGLFDKKRA